MTPMVARIHLEVLEGMAKRISRQALLITDVETLLQMSSEQVAIREAIKALSEKRLQVVK